MTPQQCIAHYLIVSKLGEGGMGAVYRATDSKLNRDVAIKILPEAFAADPDRLARFTREAQVLATLNHPNIAAVYGVEDRAIVMELVEGEDLKGPVPLAGQNVKWRFRFFVRGQLHGMAPRRCPAIRVVRYSGPPGPTG
jgi:serine/threonine-protein kinase